MGGNESKSKSSRWDGNSEECSKAALGEGEIVDIALLATGVATAGWLWSLLSSSSKRKTMKAPGRDARIFRADFESDPASYFRDLHSRRDGNSEGGSIAELALLAVGVAAVAGLLGSSSNRKTISKSRGRDEFEWEDYY